MYTFPCNLCSVPFECVTNTSITAGAASEASFSLIFFFFFKLSLAENACVTVWMEIAACSTCYEFYVAWDYSLKGFSGYSVKELCLARAHLHRLAWFCLQLENSLRLNLQNEVKNLSCPKERNPLKCPLPLTCSGKYNLNYFEIVDTLVRIIFLCRSSAGGKKKQAKAFRFAL